MVPMCHSGSEPEGVCSTRMRFPTRLAPAGTALAGRLRLPMLARPPPRFKPLPREPYEGFQLLSCILLQYVPFSACHCYREEWKVASLEYCMSHTEKETGPPQHCSLPCKCAGLVRRQGKGGRIGCLSAPWRLLQPLPLRLHSQAPHAAPAIRR